MEKETTGLYLTGHPMDEYRGAARKYHAVPIGPILSDFKNEEGPRNYRDGQRVTVAGMVSSVKTKTTKNNSLMAYVTLEDDTASVEMLCFSRVLTDSGSYLKANTPVIVQGKISVRDEKEPQIMVDRVLPLSQTPAEEESAGGQTLWIKLPDSGPSFQWLKKLLDMFPGKDEAIVYLADSKKKLRTQCLYHTALVDELTEVLGRENVVVKRR